MVSACGRYVIVFNGEVYNYRDLRRELEGKGQTFRTGTDTEVLLALYAEFREAALERIRGMYAFAVWDTAKRELFLARDRLGVKPLYVWERGPALAFASELRALRALPGGPSELDREAIHKFLRWGNVPAPHTPIQGVRCVPPGTWLRWSDGDIGQARYWSIPFGDVRHRSYDTAVEELRPILRESVALRCVSDVPVGAFLSGGVDSSAIVSLMRACGQTDLHTLSVEFPGTPLNEARFAAEVARRFGTEHVSLVADEESTREGLSDFFRVMDQPTCDGLNTYIVSRLAKQSGLTVVLSGLGGDEVFGGYATFARARRVARSEPFLPNKLRRALMLSASRLHPRLSKLDAFGTSEDLILQFYRFSRGLFSERWAALLLGGSADADWEHRDRTSQDDVSAETYDPTRRCSSYHAIMGLELGMYMHNQLLRDADVFGMAHAVEIRVPLIDHRVVEFVARTDERVLIRASGKALLREALPAPIPDVCVNRPKMGFAFPFGQWMRTTWRASIMDELCGRSASASRDVLCRSATARVWQEFEKGRLHWSRPWALYTLLRWARETDLSHS